MTLDQKLSVDTKKLNHASKLQIKIKSENTILEKLFEFARSVPDFRISNKGNIRHNLVDVIMLLIFARLSKCITRVEIIAFGKHNLVRLQKMGMFKNEVNPKVYCPNFRVHFIPNPFSNLIINFVSKLWGALQNGIPSEPTLCRVENSIDELGIVRPLKIRFSKKT